MLQALGIPKHAGDGYAAWGAYEFFVSEDPASTRRLHIGFSAPTRRAVIRAFPDSAPQRVVRTALAVGTPLVLLASVTGMLGFLP